MNAALDEAGEDRGKMDVEAATVSSQVEGGDKRQASWLDNYSVPYQTFSNTKQQVMPMPMIV